VIRIFFAAGLALVISLVGTKILIVWLTRLHIGQPIHEDVPEGHTTKAGTPTMGGIAIVVAVVVSYIASGKYRGIYTTRASSCSERSPLRVSSGSSTTGSRFATSGTSAQQAGEDARPAPGGVGFGLLIVTETQQHTQLSFTRFSSPGWELGKVGWVIWAVLLITGMSNGVNLTDGLDGLAAGAGIFAFSAFAVIGFWEFRNPHVYDLKFGLDLAVIAAAMVGACAGFCGGTRHRRASSWATPGLWPSAPASPASRWPPTRACCCR